MYYLAIDIGASSGRHILGSVENGKLVIEEMYRFPNGMKKKDGSLIWDVEALAAHVKAGIAACVSKGKTPSYIGIDTWAVDYVLLDREGKPIGDAFGYRDSRTEGMDQKVYEKIPEAELYVRTGIQKAMFNTVYQLEAVKQTSPEQLEKAETLLMIPDYLGYCLTGKACSEYTNATTGQLVKAGESEWDYELIERLGLPRRIFKPLRMPGYVVGPLSEEVEAETGCVGAKVILPPTHDTGSAVVAVPTNEEDVIYISSGTWSLIGVERLVPDTSAKSQAHNFTNEGGFDLRYRYLKNITGLWMIQSMKKELGGDYTFDMLCNMAKEYDNTPLRVDPNDSRFLAPDSMIAEVKAAVGKEDLSIGEMFSVVYHSLADCYRKSVAEIEEMLGRPMKAIHIVGGGCKDDYLCALTARACEKPVYAGPIEATAIGNLASQMIATGVFSDLAEARNVIFDSFDVKRV
ncbi:MAG: rhamnulokinase [Ruminococcaceae bacterium]|nr:rhamnulokinase [Oscillospiraceae bacterium]